MDVEKLIEMSSAMGASDIHIKAREKPRMRINGVFEELDVGNTSIEENILRYKILSRSELNAFSELGELDLGYTTRKGMRTRINVYKDMNGINMAIRIINDKIPTVEELGLPEAVREIIGKSSGLVLVTGKTGSGKSTTLASLISRINKERQAHIITLEEPIEQIYRSEKSIVTQREVGRDTSTFEAGLRSALRQDPDVILLGEMRDRETMEIAITAAETGHLVMSTLHTCQASETIDRIIDCFSTHQQSQIRMQLAQVLECVIAQELVPNKSRDGRVAAFEVMIANQAIRNLIREGKTHQIRNAILTGKSSGMQTMDSSLLRLYREGVIDKETLESHISDWSLFLGACQT